MVADASRSTSATQSKTGDCRAASAIAPASAQALGEDGAGVHACCFKIARIGDRDGPTVASSGSLSAESKQSGAAAAFSATAADTLSKDAMRANASCADISRVRDSHCIPGTDAVSGGSPGNAADARPCGTATSAQTLGK